MAVRYYDDAMVAKLKRWIPDTSRLRVLKPDESSRLMQLNADDTNDKNFKLPFVTLSRDKSIELLSNVKQNRSFDGLKMIDMHGTTAHFNVIPIKVQYQLDIYTKTYYEGDEYVRNFLFKLINNPLLIIEIPYNNSVLRHTANIRVLDTVSDTTDITEHMFPGQFTRWSIQMEIHDAFLFSIPYRNNWKFITPELEVSEKIEDPGEVETITQIKN
mgnify:CR=1 FL=1